MLTKRWNKGGAAIVGDYRYHLWRSWDDKRPRLLWVLLNPSTANAQDDDRTVERCISFSNTAGYGRLDIVNLFAYRATDPLELQQVRDPVGVGNDLWIMWATAQARAIVVAWGEQGVYCGRDRAVLALLASRPTQPLLCLDTVRNGCPRHPVRRANNAPFILYDSACTTYPVRR